MCNWKDFRAPVAFIAQKVSETVSVLRGAPVGEAELTDGDIRPGEGAPLAEKIH